VSSTIHMRIWVELTRLDGTVDRREVLTASRDTERMDASGFGLSLDVGKAVLSGLQAELTQFQVDQTSAFDRTCLGCGSLRGIQGYRHRSVHSLFGVCHIRRPTFGPVAVVHPWAPRASVPHGCLRAWRHQSCCMFKLNLAQGVFSRGGATRDWLRP
jgi:hypothetical protein